MAESLTSTLLSLQVIAHLAIALRLLFWNHEDRHYSYRPWVSRLAFLLAASSACTGLNTLFQWQVLVNGPLQPWPAIFGLIVLVGVFKARGNLAYFLPR